MRWWELMGLSFLINWYVYVSRLLGGGTLEIMEERARQTSRKCFYIQCTVPFITPQPISAGFYPPNTPKTVLSTAIFMSYWTLIYSWIYFWILYPLPLMYLFIFWTLLSSSIEFFVKKIQLEFWFRGLMSLLLWVFLVNEKVCLFNYPSLFYVF